MPVLWYFFKLHPAPAPVVGLSQLSQLPESASREESAHLTRFSVCPLSGAYAVPSRLESKPC